ncbi:MAG: YfhO family protein, partial [Chloroflexota bacterium]
YKSYVSQLIHQGELPLWNPNIFMGAPLLANIQAAVFYPLDLLFYLMPVWDALRYSVVIHIFLAALFTYSFCRISLGLSAPASCLSGVCFAFGGFLGAHIGHINQIHAAIWLPILMLCLERASSRKSVIAVSAGALTSAAQILAGHTQEVYYSVWTVGLFALYLAAFGPNRGMARIKPLVALTAIFGLGALVSSIQLLPTLELARESYRAGGIPYPEAVVYSVPLKEMLDSILPLYFEQPYLELVGYTGIFSLVLIPAALARCKRASLPFFFAGLALLALLFSLGDATPVYGWLHRWAPGFDLFRAPGRWLFVYGFAVAILAGIGIDAVRSCQNGDELKEWLARYGIGLALGLAALLGLRLFLGATGQEPSLPHPRAVLSWVSFALAAIALSITLAARPKARSILALFLALATLELYMAKEPLEYNRPAHPSLYSQANPLSDLLEEPMASHILSTVKGKLELPTEGEILQGLPPFMERAEVENHLEGLRLRQALAPNTNMIGGLRSLDGYDGGLLPTRRYALLKHHLTGDDQFRPDRTMRETVSLVPDSKLLGAFGVEHLLVNQGLGGLDPGWTQMWSNGVVTLLRNNNAKPRAYIVHQAKVIGDEQEMLEAVTAGGMDDIVLLEEEVTLLPQASWGEDQVRLVRDSSREVVIEAKLDNPGVLVLSDSFYPGWKVYVDNDESKLLRANYYLRAVQLPAGEHQVRFVFQPISVVAGLLISLIGTSIVIVAPFLGKRWVNSRL